jgi:hypothetical protein
MGVVFEQVTSKKDQEQYWIQNEKPYHYVSVPDFVSKFKKFHMGKSLKKQLSVPFHKRKIHKSALVFSEQSVPTLELLKTSWSKEWLLMKRNSFIYVFKTVQVPNSQAVSSLSPFNAILHVCVGIVGYLMGL